MANGTDAMDLLVAALPDGVMSTVDRPLRDDGVWMLDVAMDGKVEPVAWYPGRGYGLHSSEDVGYGENPDVWETDPTVAAALCMTLLASRAAATGAKLTK